MNRVKLATLLVTSAFALTTLVAPASSAFAATSSPANATSMAQDMITFLQNQSDSLDFSNLSNSDYYVYGAFLSNFFVPWSTTFGDLNYSASDPSSNATASQLADNLSVKFFGSNQQAAQFGQLNNFLYTALYSQLSSPSGTDTLYANAGHTTVLSGQGLMDKISGADSDPNIYTSTGQVVMNVDTKATRASLQVLFGLNPDYMASPTEGLSQLTALYMDGVGNIWGAYHSSSLGQGELVDASKFVLFLPASLNPAVFDPTSLNSSSSLSSLQFPATNVFSMGGTLKLGGSMPSFQPNSTAILHIPYYNLKDGNYLPQTTGATTIMGVESPFSYIGDSDALMGGSASVPNPLPAVKSFLNQDLTQPVSSSDMRILISEDPSSSSLDSDLFRTLNLPSHTAKENYWAYFLNTSVLHMSNLADDMYYFPVGGSPSASSSGNGYSPPRADFKTAVSETGGGNSSPFGVYTQKLFAAQDGQGQYSLYSNAYLSSPFNSFLSSFLQLPANVSAELGYLNRYGLSGSSASLLSYFFRTGTWNTDSYYTIGNSMTTLTDGNTIFSGLLEAPQFERTKATGGNTLSGILGNFFGLNNIMASVFALSTSDQTAGAWGISYNLPQFPANSPYYQAVGDSSSNTLTPSIKNALATEFYNFMTYRIFSMDSTFTGQLTGASIGTTFTSPVGGSNAQGTTSGTFALASPIDNGVNDYPGIYWGYMVQMLGITPSGAGWSNPIPYYNKYLPPTTFPTIGSSGSLGLGGTTGSGATATSPSPSDADMEKAILQDTYSLLSPSGSSYRDELVKATQDSWIVSTHEALVGSLSSNYSIGTGSDGTYASVVGYINTPSLSDLPLTQWLLTNYIYIYLLLLLVSVMLIILMIMTNMRSLRDGTLLFLTMAFVLLLPQFLVGNVINLSNSISNNIYSNKFNYWAIIQQQKALDNAQNAVLTGNQMDAIIASSMQDATNTYANSGVLLKWMAPKTSTEFNQLFSGGSGQGFMQNFTLFRWLFSSYLNQTQYVYNDPLADYAYMPYNYIAQEAQNSYQDMSSLSTDPNTTLQQIYQDASNAAWLSNYQFAMFNPHNKGIQYTPLQRSWLDATGPYGNAYDDYRFWPLSDTGVTGVIFSTSYTQPTGVGYNQDGSDTSPQYNAFTLTTESPFYYFYNVFQSRYNSSGQSFKDVMLNPSLYQVTNSTNPAVNGQLRDFLDMKGLFTYVIPYLQQANNYVYGYTNIHGTSISGYNFSSGGAPSSNINPQLRSQYIQQQQQKLNLEGVWNLYSPWVDQLNSLNVLDQPVQVAGQQAFVANALNPGAYQAVHRDMIFSPAQMYAEGYNYSDLSNVELRIQQVEQDTERDMMYLTNYYDFNNQVLLTAAAMDATFNFDRDFSQTNLLGTSTEIYPQNFELRDFNYDAFMSLVLLNSTGQSIMQTPNLYASVIANTSIFTGLMLLVSDVFGVFIVPTVKIVALLLLFFLSFVICISSVVTPPEKLFKSLLKHLILPSLYFVLATGAFAFVISLFMGDGLSAYVGSQTPSLGISDPTIMIILMVIVDGVYIFLLWKIIKMLFTSLRTHVTSSFYGALGLVAGASFGTLGAIKNGLSGALDYGVSRGRRDQLLNTIKGVGTSLSGGSSDSVSDHEDHSFGGASNASAGQVSEPTYFDSSFKDEIDSLASAPANDSTPTTEVASSRNMGKRLVDAKLAVQQAPSNLKDAASYVTSKDGLARDATSAVRDTGASLRSEVKTIGSDLKNTGSGVQERLSDYTTSIREYEIQRQTETVSKLEARKRYSANAAKTQAKASKRIEHLQDKVDMARSRKALLDDLGSRKSDD